MTTKLLTVPGLFKAPDPTSASLVFDVQGKVSADVCEFSNSSESSASVLLLRITDLNDNVLLCENGPSRFKFRPAGNGKQVLVMQLDARELRLEKGTYVAEVLFRYGLEPSVHRKYYLTYDGITLNP